MARISRKDNVVKMPQTDMSFSATKRTRSTRVAVTPRPTSARLRQSAALCQPPAGRVRTQQSRFSRSSNRGTYSLIRQNRSRSPPQSAPLADNAVSALTLERFIGIGDTRKREDRRSGWLNTQWIVREFPHYLL